MPDAGTIFVLLVLLVVVRVLWVSGPFGLLRLILGILLMLKACE